jgi:anhydro-N-acetylmuramic acid kinase
MSGTSMDGVDLACCSFYDDENGKTVFEITHAETIPYDEVWMVRLSQLHKQPMHLYVKTDAFYGKYLGRLINDFISKNKLEVDLIASHGHTIFHNPAEGYTAQIGNGASIHAETGIPVVSDFRTLDVALGGQGAPLVPIGDLLLFGTDRYGAYLNLGGFVNISYFNGVPPGGIAYDIGPCNIVLNRLANVAGKAFDENGEIASHGEINLPLLEQLNALPYFEQTGAKSLGREWVEDVYWPLVQSVELPLEDLMATVCEQVAIQISRACKRAGVNSGRPVFITGGGVYNGFMISRISKILGEGTIHIPDSMLIQYKEALVFAFLGLLRVRGENNALRQITGARSDSSGGALFGGTAFFTIHS